MTNKIVYFPSVLTGSGAVQVKRYHGGQGQLPFDRAELFIVIWLSGWAMLAAAECIRQMSFLAI
jgi:hypothetical protein